MSKSNQKTFLSFPSTDSYDDDPHQKNLKECDDLIKHVLELNTEEKIDDAQIERADEIVKYICCSKVFRAPMISANDLKEKKLKNAPYSIMMPEGYTMVEEENNPPNISGKFTFEAKDKNNKAVIIKKYTLHQQGNNEMTKESMIKLLYGLREIVITGGLAESPIICKTITRWISTINECNCTNPNMCPDMCYKISNISSIYQVQEKFGDFDLDYFFKYYHEKKIPGYENYKFTKQSMQQLFFDLISGLKDVHKLGITHRNITAKNIRIDSETDKNKLNVKITNFDKSRKLNPEKSMKTDLDRTAMVLAIDDCAPELYFCAIQRDMPNAVKGMCKFKYDNKVDIYSLGLIFCRILTRKNLIAYLGLDTLHVCQKTGPIDIRIRIGLFSFFGDLTKDQEKILTKFKGVLGLDKRPYLDKGYFEGKGYDTSDRTKSTLEHILRERCEKNIHLEMGQFNKKENSNGARTDISGTWVSDAIELTIKMLSLNASERPNAEEALNDKFFEGFVNKH